MNTSQSSYSQKLYTAVVAVIKFRSSSALFVSAAAISSLCKIHFSTIVSRPVGYHKNIGFNTIPRRAPWQRTLADTSGTNESSNLSIANLVAFHSLLQNFLYPSTREISKLISRPSAPNQHPDRPTHQASHSPPEVYAQSANLNASVPHCGIPLGKSFFCPAIALTISRSSKLPSLSFS
jgi:hypothetical protein